MTRDGRTSSRKKESIMVDSLDMCDRMIEEHEGLFSTCIL